MARVPMIAAILPGTVALLALTGCDIFTSPSERVAHAEQLIASGAYSEALVELNVALEKVPDDARAELALARVSLQLGSADAATRALDVAEKGGADAPQLAELRARIQQQQGHHEGVLKTTGEDSPIAQPARDLLRVRSLVALNRVPEAIELARRLRGDPATSAAASVPLAECYARLRNPGGALALLDATVRAHPDAAEAWLARGRLLQVEGHLRDAEESMSKALDAAGGQLTLMQQLNAASALAGLQLARGDLEAVRATHQKMIRLAPEGALSGLIDAQLTLADGKSAEAVAALQELIARHADVDEVRIALASAQLAAGTLEQARQQTAVLAQRNPQAANLKVASEVLRRMASMKPDGTDYSLSAAAVHLALGQGCMARLALRRTLQIQPDSQAAMAALGQLELRTGNVSEAERIATSMTSNQPKDPAALALLAEVYRTEGAYPKAAATLERLAGESPTAATALALARVRQEGNLGGAPAALAPWVTAHPDDYKMRGAYADALRLAGENSQAIAEFEKVLAREPKSVPALNNLAWLYYLEKDARAAATARRAWQLAPQMPNVADTYGWLLVESGAVQEGANILEGAYQDGGMGDPDIRYHYGAALARIGQVERATLVLRQLLDEVPEFAQRDAAQSVLKSLP